MPRRAIAHVLPWENVGGTELATVRFAFALRDHGYANVMYVPEGAAFEDVADLVRDHGFPLARYRQVAPRKANPFPFFANTARLAADFVRRGVGLVHGADTVGAYFSSWPARLAGAHATSHVRGAHLKMANSERWLLKPVERFVYVSRATMKEQDFVCPPGAAEVLYDAAIPPSHVVPRDVARAHYGLAADAVVFGMAARFHPQKDHISLIAAAARVKAQYPKVRFLMAGDLVREAVHREHFARLEALMAETGTRDIFVFPGFEADMPRFYGAIDVCMLATHTEGFPLGILEAMGAGLPVIASDVGGNGEAVVNGDTGILVKDEDVPGFAAAISRLAGDEALRSAMGRAGRERARSRFGQERFVKEAGAFAERMLGAAS